MSFADALSRLREAAANIQFEECRVRRADLQELLHHFDRQEQQLRAQYDQRNNPETKRTRIRNQQPNAGLPIKREGSS